MEPWKDCPHKFVPYFGPVLKCQFCGAATTYSMDGKSKPIFPPPRPTEQEESPATVDDLAMLVKQLVRELKKYNLNDKLQARAMDYLKRKGLQGSPFSR